jgi:hypothetical protein
MVSQISCVTSYTVLKGVLMTKKSKIKIDLEKDELESLKNHLDMIIETLINFDFERVALIGTNVKQMYENMLINHDDLIETSKVSKQKKEELMMTLMGVGPKYIINQKDYLQQKIDYGEYLLREMSYKKKVKVVENALISYINWSRMFDRCSEIHKELDKTNTKKRQVK